MTRRSIVHIEIPAAIRAESAKFYADMFGWEIEPMDEMNYTMWKAGSDLGGGFPDVDGKFSQPDRVLIYIDSENIEADLQRIEAHGGKTAHPKMEISGMGWWAAFTDPTGNTIGLYQSAPKG